MSHQGSNKVVGWTLTCLAVSTGTFPLVALVRLPSGMAKSETKTSNPNKDHP